MDGWSICQLTPLFLDGLKALYKLISEKLAGFQHVYVIVAYIEENLQPIHVKNVNIKSKSLNREWEKIDAYIRVTQSVSLDFLESHDDDDDDEGGRSMHSLIGECQPKMGSEWQTDKLCSCILARDRLIEIEKIRSLKRTPWTPFFYSSPDSLF